MCKAGSELGNTFHGHHDMQLQNDAVRKIMIGHYTFYSRAVVKNPKLVSVVEDVFCQDYVAGEGHTFFDLQGFKDAWMDQSIGTKRCRQSLLAWRVPAGKAKDLPDAIDLMVSLFPNCCCFLRSTSNHLIFRTHSFIHKHRATFRSPRPTSSRRKPKRSMACKNWNRHSDLVRCARCAKPRATSFSARLLRSTPSCSAACSTPPLRKMAQRLA